MEKKCCDMPGFIFKNILFALLLLLPFCFKSLGQVYFVLLSSVAPKKIALPYLWGSFVVILWALWFVGNVFWFFIRVMLGIKSPHLLLAEGFVALDGDDAAQLSKLLKRRFMGRAPVGALLRALQAKKTSLLTFREALSKASAFPMLQVWVLRQRARLELSGGDKKRGYEILRDLYDQKDYCPFTLKSFLECALFYDDIDLAQQVLYVVKKKKFFSSERLSWEGQLLLKKALLWKGAARKKEWLLEKALVLLPQEAQISCELAQLYLDEENIQKAEEVIASAWRLRPFEGFLPLVFKIYARSTKTESYENIKKFIEGQEENPLSIFLLGAYAMRAELKPVTLACAEKLMDKRAAWGLFLKGLLHYSENKKDSFKLVKQGMGVMDPVMQTVMEGLKL